MSIYTAARDLISATMERVEQDVLLPLAPNLAVSRMKQRQVYQAYSAGKPNIHRSTKPQRASGGVSASNDAASIRDLARALDEDHDLVTGVFNVLVANCIGPSGVGLDPQPMKTSGKQHKTLARQLNRLWEDWCRRPEVTHEMEFSEAQKLAFRTFVRDGEVFAVHHQGNVTGLDHGTQVPYSVELLEPDFVPITYDDPSENLYAGIVRNAWGRALSYKVYKSHPGGERWHRAHELKDVPAYNMVHAKLVKRLHQGRGVSLLHSVIDRLDAIKDYEENEQIAARIASRMAAYVKKGSPDQYQSMAGMPGKEGADARDLVLDSGTIFDGLKPGEDVGTIESNRPSTLLEPYRNAMLKAVSAGTGAGYSTISKSYDGTYAAQRQELVEQFAIYGVLAHSFIHQFIKPIYERFVDMCVASGLIVVPKGLDILTLYDADYILPGIPWIDPNKEAQAYERLIQAGVSTVTEVIRLRGRNPGKVQAQLLEERQWAKDNDVVLSSDARHGLLGVPAEEPEEHPPAKAA